jgi:hypothetical protein
MGSFKLRANTVASPAAGAIVRITAASSDAGVISIASLATPLLGLLLLRPART